MAAHRAIRALYDKDCIVVYQAYNKEIAEAAVREQKLSASPSYSPNRTTWIKPSFCWMMYRSGYPYKDANQAHLLALRIKHRNFKDILRQACLASKPHNKIDSIIVQWDPERSPRLSKLDYRSIQIGITGSFVQQLTDEWIESIEDVTDIARKLKERLDREPNVGEAELVDSGLNPHERPYTMPDDIRKKLEID